MKISKVLLLIFFASTAHSAEAGTWICSASCYAPGSQEYLPMGLSGNDPNKMLEELNDKCRRLCYFRNALWFKWITFYSMEYL
jgi:hypothetical protein